MPRVTGGMARCRTLTAPWPRVPSIGQNLQSFTGNDLHMSEKFLSGTKHPKQIKTKMHLKVSTLGNILWLCGFFGNYSLLCIGLYMCFISTSCFVSPASVRWPIAIVGLRRVLRSSQELHCQFFPNLVCSICSVRRQVIVDFINPSPRGDNFGAKSFKLINTRWISTQLDSSIFNTIIIKI